MLSLLLMEVPDAARHLVDFYKPNHRRLVDVTAGLGKMSSRIERKVLVDLVPRVPGVVQADAAIALPFRSGAFDVAVFDPPYLYGGRTSKKLHGRPNAEWQDQHSLNTSPLEFRKRAEGVAAELYRVLEPGGVSVVKVADSRLSGELVLNHQIVDEAFCCAGHVRRDVVVYARLGTGVFKNTRTAQNAHGYYLIFERPR